MFTLYWPVQRQATITSGVLTTNSVDRLTTFQPHSFWSFTTPAPRFIGEVPDRTECLVPVAEVWGGV